MITECKSTDLNELVSLAKEIYTSSSTEKLIEGFRASLEDSQNQVFAYQENHKIIGFAEMSIRHDYVEGINQTFF